MHIHVAVDGSFLIVEIDGRFDAHGIDEFDRAVIQRIDDDHNHVIVNLERVEFMDSSALASLVRVLKATVTRSGSITLASVSDSARIILELTRLDAVFPSSPSVADARDRVLQGV
jgi:anti-sigma B factor antagonist